MGNSLTAEEVLDKLGLEKQSIARNVLGASLLIAGGALAGAAAALLFAPRAGRDLRADIAHKFQSMRKNGRKGSQQESGYEGMGAESSGESSRSGATFDTR